MLNRLKPYFHKIAETYQRIEHYFTDGSFAIKFYPFLMHPCVRHTRKNIIRLFAGFAVFCAVYYLIGELITVLFSTASLEAYAKHTVLELLLPLDSVVDDKKSTLSPLFYTMQIAIRLQMWLFIPFYFICLTQITSQRLRLLTACLAVLFSIGAGISASSQGGQYTVGGLQNLGFEISFLIAGLIMLLVGWAITLPHLSRVRHYSFMLGLLGLAMMLIPLFIETPFTPIFERISIYSLMIWEMMMGFAVLRSLR